MDRAMGSEVALGPAATTNERPNRYSPITVQRLLARSFHGSRRHLIHRGAARTEEGEYVYSSRWGKSNSNIFFIFLPHPYFFEKKSSPIILYSNSLFPNNRLILHFCAKK
jgi:hypothetical protein